MAYAARRPHSCFLTALVTTIGAIAAVPAAAQVSDVPRILTSANGPVSAAVQIGRRLFVGGNFTALEPPLRGLALVDGTGQVVAAGLPPVNGAIVRAVSDGGGGVVIAGDFTHVGTVPQARLARLRPDGSLDRTLRVSADDAITDVAVAHGRIYLVGAFTRINGEPRRGFAALEAATGGLTSWGAQLAPGQVHGRGLAVSSTAVYVRGYGRLWGLDAGTGEIRFRREVFVGALAATSARLYVSLYGPNRVVGLDPATGQEDGWAVPFRFRFIPASYGQDGTSINDLVVDGNRLFVAGRFDPDDNGVDSLAVIDVATGERLPWPGVNGEMVLRVVLVGDVAVLPMTFGQTAHVRHRVTGAALPVDLPVRGMIESAVATSHGVVLAGDFRAGVGTPRTQLAAIELDSGGIAQWSVAGLPPFGRVTGLATDGAALFAAVDGPSSTTLRKIDPATGAILATLTAPAPSFATSLALAGDRLVVAARTVNGTVVWAVDVTSWSLVPSGVNVDGFIAGLAVAGHRLYLAGAFFNVNGEPRGGLAAVDPATGTLLPWDPRPDGPVSSVVADASRVWASGTFRTVGGQRRRGLAELDAATGEASAWNPDVPSGFRPSGLHEVGNLARASDGTLVAQVSGPAPSVSGQAAQGLIAFAADGRRLPWSTPTRPQWITVGSVAATPDCIVVLGWTEVECHGPIVPPASLTVSQAGAVVSLAWAAGGPAVTGWRLEVGREERRSDLVVLDLPASQTSISAPLAAGSYVARLRAITAEGLSLATSDVSFAVGRPAAPLDVKAVVSGRTLALDWRPPSTGAPASYFLEAGASPGGTGLGLVLPGGSTSYAADLPAGEFTARLYAVTNGVRSQASADVRIDVDATAGVLCPAPPPPAPLNLRAVVAPGQVQILWDLAPGATLPPLWTLHAGTVPGASDVGVFNLPGGALAIGAPVARGTYYVRITAAPYCFSPPGPASAELRIDVP